MNNQTSLADLLKVSTENSLAATLIGALILGLFAKLWQYYIRWTHEARVINFLQLSARDGRYQFRTTAAIAAETKLTEARVEDICSAHRRVKRNTAQKQSWRLKDE